MYHILGFIAGRIWWVNRATSKFPLVRSGGGDLANAMIIIVESGAIYSIWLLAGTILYATGSYAVYVALDSVSKLGRTAMGALTTKYPYCS
jgi:hypothetical protein